MSKKLVQQYVCQDCGCIHPKWSGKCNECGIWNSLVLESIVKTKGISKIAANSATITKLDDEALSPNRIMTGIGEFDRVLGGGIVEGGAILLGGDPGIGKSTLILQILDKLCQAGNNTLYVSGEESFQQIKLRANRLQVKSKDINISCTTSLNEIKQIAKEQEGLKLLVIDSIQTIYDDTIDSSPGTVSQVKSCTFELIRHAKESNYAVLFIGHVTKEGAIAGPKVLEHMVDTVLYFEGDRSFQYRMIRAIKNRFGPANELSVFEMNESGLHEVQNPSKYFLPDNDNPQSGSTIFAGMEGSRPILLEIQALCVPSFLASPRRAVIGWDTNRLAMLIAVLNARLSINILDKEVYLNMVGGLKVSEPAADLAVIAALISAVKNRPISRDYVFFGEVGLSGETRSISHIESRVREAEKLGFKCVVMPNINKNFSCKIEVITVNHINDLLKII